MYLENRITERFFHLIPQMATQLKLLNFMWVPGAIADCSPRCITENWVRNGIARTQPELLWDASITGGKFLAVPQKSVMGHRLRCQRLLVWKACLFITQFPTSRPAPPFLRLQQEEI